MGEKKKTKMLQKKETPGTVPRGVIHPHTCPAASSPLPRGQGIWLEPGTTEIPTSPHKNLLAKEKPRGTVCLAL